MSTKIKPAIRGPKNYANFAELDVGESFIYHNMLYIKMEDIDSDYEQCAVCLLYSTLEYDMCNSQVLPVDVVINWTKQKE